MARKPQGQEIPSDTNQHSPRNDAQHAKDVLSFFEEVEAHYEMRRHEREDGIHKIRSVQESEERKALDQKEVRTYQPFIAALCKVCEVPSPCPLTQITTLGGNRVWVARDGEIFGLSSLQVHPFLERLKESIQQMIENEPHRLWAIQLPATSKEERLEGKVSIQDLYTQLKTAGYEVGPTEAALSRKLNRWKVKPFKPGKQGRGHTSIWDIEKVAKEFNRRAQNARKIGGK